MILADKIIMLRKKNGWSQEELAGHLDISRQSVSKWESGASIPDLDKIIKLSSLFGVSTDYLLIEEHEELSADEGLVSRESDEFHRREISVEEAETFLASTRDFARMIGLGVALCILSPVTLILLSTMAETGMLAIPKELAEGVGAIVLLVLVAIAVAIFILNGLHYAKYDYLEQEVFVTEYGVEGIVSKRKESFESPFATCISIGVGLCILAVLPLLFMGMSDAGEMAEAVGASIFFTIVAGAVFLLIWAGIIHGSFDKLLQSGDYSLEKKHTRRKFGSLSGVYWSVVTAVYLCWSFVSRDWHCTWIVWPVAGVLWGAVVKILGLFAGEDRESRNQS